MIPPKEKWKIKYVKNASTEELVSIIRQETDNRKFGESKASYKSLVNIEK